MLKSRYFIYDLVENTVSRKQTIIDLILLESVQGIGLKGQKVSIPSEKAYNNFLLPKLAVYASPENIEKYFIEDTEFQKMKNIKSSKHVDRTLNTLSHLYLYVHMSMHTPWTIEKWHIRISFQRSGFIVPEDAITLSEKPISGPDLSLENKEFYVTVKINNQEEVKVRCRLRHWSSDLKNQAKSDVLHWDLPSVAIFPEDQPILDSLPKHRLCKNITNDITE